MMLARLLAQLATCAAHYAMREGSINWPEVGMSAFKRLEVATRLGSRSALVGQRL